MERFQFIPGMLEEAIAEGVFPSASVGIGLKGQTLYTCAAGKISLPNGAPVNLDTRYDLASMTKIIAPTMLALMALETGLLTLDDTLSRFFDAPHDKADITVFHLMTHTGGITPSFLLENACQDPAGVLQAILHHPLEGPPGQMPRYSCMGYILLGFILEKVYGKPLDKLAKELVFAPLGMSHTGYCPAGGNIAATEINAATGLPWQGTVHDENARFMKGVSANAGLFSDAGDVMRFAAMLSSGGTPLINPATLRLAIKDRTPGHDIHRGLGFHISGGPGSFMGDLFPAASFGHTGFTGTSLAVDPETGLYAVLLTNAVHPKRGNPAAQRFRRLFHNRVFAAAFRDHLSCGEDIQ
jgi:CubicO group peptidase (beta-lactamase class C family)